MPTWYGTGAIARIKSFKSFKAMRVAKDIPTIIPHADFGAPDCCGCLFGRIAGDRGIIVCKNAGPSLAGSRQGIFSEPWMSLSLRWKSLLLCVGTATLSICVQASLGLTLSFAASAGRGTVNPTSAPCASLLFRC